MTEIIFCAILFVAFAFFVIAWLIEINRKLIKLGDLITTASESYITLCDLTKSFNYLNLHAVRAQLCVNVGQFAKLEHYEAAAHCERLIKEIDKTLTNLEKYRS